MPGLVGQRIELPTVEEHLLNLVQLLAEIAATLKTLGGQIAITNERVQNITPFLSRIIQATERISRTFPE